MVIGCFLKRITQKQLFILFLSNWLHNKYLWYSVNWESGPPICNTNWHSVYQGNIWLTFLQGLCFSCREAFGELKVLRGWHSYQTKQDLICSVHGKYQAVSSAKRPRMLDATDYTQYHIQTKLTNMCIGSLIITQSSIQNKDHLEDHGPPEVFSTSQRHVFRGSSSSCGERMHVIKF